MKTVFAFGVAAAIVGIACAAGRSAGYDAELEWCLKASPDCEQYVSCRHAIAKKYDRPFDGGCVVDGGTK